VGINTLPSNVNAPLFSTTEPSTSGSSDVDGDPSWLLLIVEGVLQALPDIFEGILHG
jgi:hypothetical protein